MADAQPSLPRSGYVHVPFCAHRCGYCNFSVIAGRNDLADEYIAGIAWELQRLGNRETTSLTRLDTLYFGGGTPTQLTADQFRRLFELVTSHLPVAENAEITVEANPSDLDEEYGAALVELGVNRISLGAQSFQDSHLRTLERDHTGAHIAQVVSILRQAGIASISIDLIFAVPEQSMAHFENDLAELLSLNPDHVSTYGLTFEKGTSFYQRLNRSELEQASEDLEREMYLTAVDTLSAAQYEHYEVSSFARREKRSRHNEVYWTGQPYYAFGPGASRFVDGRRETNHRSVTTYLRRIRTNRSPVAESESLSPEDAARERLVFALRRMEGIRLSEFRAQTGFEVEELVADEMTEFVRLGLLELSHERLRLTRAGLLVSDSIWPAFL